MNCLRLPIILALLSSVANFSHAEDVQAVHLGKQTSAQQVIDILSPKETGARPKTRGLALHSSQSAKMAKPKPRALSLEVYFEFDSAELLQSAREQLKPIGEAFQSKELSSVTFVLEGHTDAKGDANYNLSLSERRAISVKQFFKNQYGIPTEKIRAIGRGESKLFDKENPDSGVNRRVTIIAN